MFIDQQRMDQWQKRYRVNLINSLSGFKSANLIGSCADNGDLNLALFSSVFHIGAEPALMGMLSRPHSVPRHTLENIRATGEYTINNVTSNIYREAHLCSARSERDESEFEFSGLQPAFHAGFKAPAVKQSPLQIFLQLEEIQPLAINNTVLIIGSVQGINIEDKALEQDGLINHETLQSVAINGLDSYHRTESLKRLKYAKKDYRADEL